MRRLKALLLLSILCFTIFPWQVVCAAHPMGHEHHAGNEPSVCDLHRAVSGASGEHLLPPMECNHFDSSVDEYQSGQTLKSAVNPQVIIVLSVFLRTVEDKGESLLTTFLIPPIPNCRSATLQSDSPLRAPPLV